jgi:hypothetical protein
MLQADFSCQAGSPLTLTLEQGLNPSQTQIVSKGVAVADASGNEVLTINCVDPAALVGGAQADLAGAATSSNATGAIAGASVAALLALVGIAWTRRANEGA